MSTTSDRQDAGMVEDPEIEDPVAEDQQDPVENADPQIPAYEAGGDKQFHEVAEEQQQRARRDEFVARAKAKLGPTPVGKAKRIAVRAIKDPKGIPNRTRHFIHLKQRRYEDYRRFMRKEFLWDTSWSNRRPTWWLRGFLSRSVTLYQLDDETHDPKEYVNDVQRYTRTKHMVSPFLQEVLNNKFSFFLLVGALGLKSEVVPLLGLYSRGQVSRFPNAERLPLKPFLEEILAERRHIFMKPLRGAEANGVRSLKLTNDGGYRLDGSPATLDEAVTWAEKFGKPLLFEAAVSQHEFEASLNPDATNTLRVLTMPDLDDEDQSPFIAAAVHRIGTSRSGHIDNWTKGGLSANINLDTGELSRAGQLPLGRELEWFTHHPDTGTQIEGATVPYWQETKELILDAAERLGFMEYVGWDVIISPTGPVILEANINSGMNVIQVHGPLLEDPRVRKYYTARRAI